MLPSLPVIIPLITGILLLLMRDLGGMRRLIAVLSLLVQGIVAIRLWMATFSEGILVNFLGSWEAPIGIAIIGDKASAMLVLLALIVTLCSTLVSFSEKSSAEENPMRLPLVQFLLTGIQLSFLTGDLFNLFVAFEVMLLSSYALMTLEAEKNRIKDAYPYIIINLVGSAVFLAGCGYTYALFGTLNFAGIAEASRLLAETPEGAARVTTLAALLALVFSIKAGMFPLYYWLPNSYPILPASLGALYSGLLTKVGIYVLLRLFGTLMPPNLDSLYLLVAWLGGGTMFFGVMGAISRSGIREILAFHVISQVGFMILAIGFFTPAAFAATLFYMAHHIIVKSGLFLTAAGVLHRFGTDRLDRIGGLWKSHPLFGVVFLVLALSLAGLPPLSGFWAKLWILLEGLSGGYYFLVGVSLVASVLTLASMLKIWLGAFWKPLPPVETQENENPARYMRLGLGLTVILSLAVMVAVKPLWYASISAADELMNPQAYVEKVLGKTEKP